MDTDPPLIKQAMTGLDSQRGRWPQIAREARVSYSWLCKFAIGGIPDPGVRRVQRVVDVLTKSPDVDEAAA